MRFNFSQQLKNRVIDYFANEYHRNISMEQAEEFLNSLADFYIFLLNKI